MRFQEALKHASTSDHWKNQASSNIVHIPCFLSVAGQNSEATAEHAHKETTMRDTDQV
jgi:hypothetical protein